MKKVNSIRGSKAFTGNPLAMYAIVIYRERERVYVDMVVSQPKLSLGWLMSVVWNCLEKRARKKNEKKGHTENLISPTLCCWKCNRQIGILLLLLPREMKNWWSVDITQFGVGEDCNVFVRRSLEAIWATNHC